ncbi:(5-formylfuran-3-yl)methyl phosphate synthase [Aquabacterium sp.]|uniref:(5-formylfuran-3-yl)methyl phosphate synthase n=1 Tax=Aquabacterium sp. TaxID=1872578 RepID=UPI002CD4C3F0|nr:(5-formylfuran-3-yl)methyl phosphate synthase [Aquabacterium sp.]HSW08758.1 (5-formylfuran-3-yl)methyl phosphate synthase [Aquabacterium sp.]
MRLLVSVRSVDEALIAARGGADFIDLKEPRAGALGGLPVATIRAIVAALREQGITLPVSATIGDLPMDSPRELLTQVHAVGACAVDYVKVGIEPVPQASAVLDALAVCGWPIVPVFLADRGIDFAQLDHACRLGFPGIMADTADKHAGSLFDAVPPAALRRFVACVREAGVMVGLAGALRAADAPALLSLEADFAGFRTAVCQGDRGSELDPLRLRSLAAALRPSILAATD